MTITDEGKQLKQVVRRIDPQARLLRVWQLKGGVSAQVTALQVEQAGGRRKKMVVRRYGSVDLQRNPHVALTEFRLLRLLHSARIAAPEPYYLDETGEVYPTPYVVVEYVEGEPGLAPSAFASSPTGTLRQFATHLARIHAVDDTNADLSFLPSQDATVAGLLAARTTQRDESLDEGRIRGALESAWPRLQPNRPVLLHGDFWPGNTLWRDGQLVSVVDWEDAAVGDPLADLADSRLELLWAFGVDAMQRFTGLYQSIAGFDDTTLPYWDLYAALRPISKIATWNLDADTEKTMREQHRWFTAQAFKKLEDQ